MEICKECIALIVIWLLTVIHQFIQVISIQILEFHRRPLQL